MVKMKGLFLGRQFGAPFCAAALQNPLSAFVGHAA